MSPRENGALGCKSQLTFEKGPGGMDLLEEKGRVNQLLRDLKSKSGEESSSSRKQRDEQCGGQSSKPKEEVLAPYCLGGLRGSVSQALGFLQ